MSRFRFTNMVAAFGAAVTATTTALAQHEEHRHTAQQTPQAQPHEHGEAAQPAPHGQSQRPSDPYALTTCPVSGKRLGSMGDPVVKVYDGREVRFCCEGCIGRFEAAKDEYWKKVDEQIAKEQTPYYPLTTCVLSGEPLVENGEDIAINFVYRNRLMRFCCRGCVKDFLKDPEPTLKKLDATVFQQQQEHYPLQTCVVSGEALGSMGEPYEVVIGNRLVRLCCKTCEKKLRTTPLEYLPALDEAWRHQGMPKPTDTAPELGHDDHGHDDVGHGEHDGHGGS